MIESSEQFFYGGGAYIDQIVRCRFCGFAHIATPETERAQEFYRQADIGPYLAQQGMRGNYFSKVRLIAGRRGLNFARITSIMDFGAGDGEWLTQWPGTRWYATESQPQLARLLTLRGATVLSDQTSRPPAVDMVSAFDFLEHLVDPRVFLRAAALQMSSATRLIIGVPDMGAWAARLFGKRYYLVCPMHYSYFTARALTELLTHEFPGSLVSVFPSPAMQVSLAGLSRWLGNGGESQRVLPLPLYYRASLIGLVLPKEASRAAA